MPSPSDVLKEIVKTVYRAQAVRYKLAGALMNRLKQMPSEPSVFEVNGYQTYVWVPKGRAKEYRVWPPSLTAPPEGWLKTRDYAPKDPIIPVNWNAVYSQLAPKFSIKLAVLDSIRDLLNMLTAAEIVTEAANPSEWGGRCSFNGMPAWYRLEADRMVIMYYDETLQKWVSETVAYSGEIEACGIKKWINMALDSISQGIYVTCPDGTSMTVSYEAPLCSDLDQMVSYLRQLAEKQSYCVVYRPKSLYFIDGPLAGVSWSEESTPPWLFYSPSSGVVMTDSQTLGDKIQRAVDLCSQKLKRYYCTSTT
jgi:hypothetical protein